MLLIHFSFSFHLFLFYLFFYSVAAIEAACSSTTSDWRPLTRSQSVISSSKFQQQAQLGAVPLTITKLTKKLKEREDEIFELWHNNVFLMIKKH